MSIIITFAVAGLGFIFFSPDYNLYIVRGESMKPAINMGDMIVTGPLNGPLSGPVNSGTIVSYDRGKGTVTHRVLSVEGDMVVTKGDAVEDSDPWLVTLSDVTGIYLIKIPYAGYLSNYMRTKSGWFAVVIIPAMLLVSLLIKDIVKESWNST